MLEGFLNLWKPGGVTSHDAIKSLRRITGEDRIGHAGTLDPDASGVLPVAFGRYTKLLEFARLTPKVYRATVVWGVLTHSGDAGGRATGWSGPPFPDQAALEAAGRWLTGNIIQIPPAVSALHLKGRRQYDLVRKGRPVWPHPRQAAVDEFRVIGGEERRWTVEVSVGPGTYIRSLVRDWGYLLGQAAHLTDLCRTRVGGFLLPRAHTLEECRRPDADWTTLLESWEDYLAIPVIPVDGQTAEALRQGRPGAWPPMPQEASGPHGLAANQTLVAVIDGPPWHYRKVL